MPAKKRAAPRPRGRQPIHVAVINATEEERIPRRRLAKVVAALQKQIARDFTPVWGVAARLSLVADGEAPPPDAWWLTLHDDSNRADDDGYHELTEAGLPLGKAFVSTARDDDTPWSMVLSHELLEMLIDPYLNLAAALRNGRGGILYGYEICDPCRGDTYRIDGVAVSNFVYPAWFEEHGPRRGRRFDHAKRISRPFAVRPGGYSIVNDLAGKKGWQQVSGKRGKKRRPRAGSRVARRAADAAALRRSRLRKRKRRSA